MSIHPYRIAAEPAQDGVLRVFLAGQFDMSVGTGIVDTLTTAASGPGVTHLVVDMDGVEFFDSHGVAGLVAGYEAAHAAGRRFSVVNTRGMVTHILDVTGLSEVFRPDEHAADAH
ncbi:STAS domain-containing protein [Actinoplanes sp. NPDC051494]|uniref:STAS domain-containing protein n=1 Tax=Actinoplanes sp. NPDC051494 TaxID=3363907 RepID=UPI0037A191F7